MEENDEKIIAEKDNKVFNYSIPGDVVKEDGVTCPICFGEYTSSGDHRIVSMKCGHLFGNSCILEWYKKRKIVLCPICGIKCSKSQLRLIFSSKVVALNHEKELKLIEQYIYEFNEKKKLMDEVATLKTEIEVLKLNIKTECTCTAAKKSVYKVLSLFCKIKCEFSTKGSIIMYDEINGCIIISSIKDNFPCLIKYYDSGVSSTKVFKELGYISNMKYLEGNVVISIGCKILIINMYNCNIIYEDMLPNRITAVEGFISNRDKLVVGDDKGFITVFELGISKKISKICNVPIHSLFCTDKLIYIGTVYNVYKLEIQNVWEEIFNPIVLNVDIDSKTCINIFGEESRAVLVYRLKNNKIIHYHVEDTEEKIINFSLRQISKFKEMMFNRLYHLVDQFENKILVGNVHGEKVFEFQVEENVVSFYVCEGIMIVLSEVFIYVYK